MSKTELSPKELALINNIINKLQIYMDKTNETLHGLSEKLGFEYQPFYRLMKNKKLPTISTLSMITDHLQCSIEELINDKLLIKAYLVDSLEGMLTTEIAKTVHISIPIEDYLPYIHNDFVAVRIKTIEDIKINYCKLYCTLNQINTEGTYIVQCQDQIKELNVISTSSKFIIVEQDKKEVRIPQEEIRPIGKLINDLLLFEKDCTSLHGVKDGETSNTNVLFST